MASLTRLLLLCGPVRIETDLHEKLKQLQRVRRTKLRVLSYIAKEIEVKDFELVIETK